jgi:hypothetical protein
MCFLALPKNNAAAGETAETAAGRIDGGQYRDDFPVPPSPLTRNVRDFAKGASAVLRSRASSGGDMVTIYAAVIRAPANQHHRRVDPAATRA